MKSNFATLTLLPALALLAACGDEAEEPVAEQAPTSAGAQGEVLGGTISDDMLPLDTLESQSPPLSGGGDEDGAGDENGESGDADSE